MKSLDRSSRDSKKCTIFEISVIAYKRSSKRDKVSCNGRYFCHMKAVSADTKQSSLVRRNLQQFEIFLNQNKFALAAQLFSALEQCNIKSNFECV